MAKILDRYNLHGKVHRDVRLAIEGLTRAVETLVNQPVAKPDVKREVASALNGLIGAGFAQRLVGEPTPTDPQLDTLGTGEGSVTSVNATSGSVNLSVTGVPIISAGTIGLNFSDDPVFSTAYFNQGDSRFLGVAIGSAHDPPTVADLPNDNDFMIGGRTRIFLAINSAGTIYSVELL